MNTQPKPQRDWSLPSTAYFRGNKGDKNNRSPKRTREEIGRPWARICLCLLSKQSKLQPDLKKKNGKLFPVKNREGLVNRLLGGLVVIEQHRKGDETLMLTKQNGVN